MTSGRFGIHMGNSTVCLSILKEGKVDIVASKFGDRASYAVLAAADDDEFLIGLSAKQCLVRSGPITVINNFQFLNEELSREEFKEAAQNCVCGISESPLEYKLVKDDINVTITPYEVAVRLLENLNENATQAAKSDTDLEAVISVPIYFSAKSRKIIAGAAKEAGFEILQVISEPSAALVAYEIGFELKEQSNVLVYRLGGLTCDIAIMNVRNGMYQKVASTRLPQTGGNLLTKALSDYMATEFYNKYKLDPRDSRRTMTKLWQHAENCKHILSTMQSAHVFIESLMDGVDWSQNVSRARFENVITSLLTAFLRPIEELVFKHEISIDKIIYCGGSMKIPKLQSAIAALFPKAQILNTIPSDEVIAIGCARQASFINDAWDTDGEHLDMEISTITNDICIETSDSDRQCLFSKGTPLPVDKRFTIQSKDGKICLKVHQGDYINIVENSIGTSNVDTDIRAKIHVSSTDRGNTVNFIFPSVD